MAVMHSSLLYTSTSPVPSLLSGCSCFPFHLPILLSSPPRKLSPSTPTSPYPVQSASMGGPPAAASDVTFSSVDDLHVSSTSSNIDNNNNSGAHDTDPLAFLASVMPKEEIGAERFIASHPHYDGRGIIIAIFDSGVDPAAAGLQITSDGRPKIVDILDCTGSGDVDTSKVVKADKDGVIKGASGSRLQVNPTWKNPTGEWHVGYKLAYELFTETLTSRLKKERKKKWDEKHAEAVTEALRQISMFDQKNPRATDSPLKKVREDLQNQIDLLQKLSESYDDKGPIIDAVVWNDGDIWRVALDTQEMDANGGGKLADFVPLTNYRIERKYGVFSSIDACSFVTNVYEDGNILSIVTDSSPHGTHVAGITAAYHPEEPLLCGVAPGAQLISCKIGDSRLGSMETGTGLIRALISVVENKCHLINMSYGEPTSAPDYGRFVELANEVVNKYGVIFVSSAGNAGPSLNTVGAPGGTSSSIIGIGAYLSPAMAISAHSIVEPPLEGLQYTWSSRGPTADGDIGVCLSAPGAAIAPVPQWTLQRRMLMNGTSMSSPCACGGIALILSALKAQGQQISPWVVRKALENTAAPIGSAPEDILTTGFGLLQVDRAYEYLQNYVGRPAVWYQIQVNRNGNAGSILRGVYLREPSDCCQATEWSVQVKPMFHEDTDKINIIIPFEERIRIESRDAAWVRCPEYVLLTHNGRSFNVLVDPTQLTPGFHCSEIYGIDCDAPWRGPVFRIPITILKPFELRNQPPIIRFPGLSFIPGHIERRFIVVPAGATWAEATMKVSGFDTPRRFYLNAVQILPQKRPVVSDNIFLLSGPSVKQLSFRVQAEAAMELTIAQFWSSGSGSHSPAVADVEIMFHGLVPSKNEICLNGGDVVTRVDVTSLVGVEILSPRAILHKVRIPYRPVESTLQALNSDRDKLPNGRQILSLILTYKFTLSEDCKVTPKFPILNRRIYDNEFESQFYMISDVNKRVHVMGDVYPKGVKLPKGDFTLRLFVRHDNMIFLEKLKKSVIFIDKSLEEKNYIQLSLFSRIDGAITGGFGFKSATLLSGETQVLHIASPAEDKLPKDLPLGSVLLGKITYGKVSSGNSNSGKIASSCPASYRIICVVPPPVKSEEKPKEKDAPQKKSCEKVCYEQVRDAKVKVLASLPCGTQEEREVWNKLATSLQMEYPNELKLLHEVLLRVSATRRKEDGKNGIDDVIVAADAIISIIDKEALAKYFGVNIVAEEPDAMEIKQEMEKQRDALVDALYKKALSLAELEDESLVDVELEEGNKVEEMQTVDVSDGDASERKEEKAPSNELNQNNTQDSRFDETYNELRKWVDITTTKYSLLNVIYEKRAGRLGTAIKAVTELIQDEGKAPKKSLIELQIKLIEQKGWLHWASYARRWMTVRFPEKLPPF